MKKLSFIAANLLALITFSQNVTKITFDNDADLTSNFYVPDGSTGTFVDGNVLKITPGQSRTLVYDTSPDATPSNIFSGDFVLSFKFNSNTAQLIPPTANVSNQNISVWASIFPQSAPRLNSPRIRLNLSEMYQDETYFEQGTSMNNSDASATSTPIEAINFFRELSPAYNGDTWYTFRLIVLQQGGGNVKCNFTVSDGDNELINNTYTFTGLTTTTGEIAIGGNSNNALTALSIDDFQVSTVIPAFTEHIYQETTVSGSSFHMYLPPGISSVSGILVLAPGSSANFFYVLQTDYHRKFAQAHNLALLSFQQFNGSTNADLLSAVSNFATQTGHLELNNAPYMFYGFSYGTITTNDFVNAYPEKVIAYTSDAYITAASYNSNTYSIPGLFLSGDNGDVTSIGTQITDLDPKRALHAQMGALVKQNYPHLEMGMFKLYLPFFEQAINGRNLCNTGTLNLLDETKGWLMTNTLDSIGFYASGNSPIKMTAVYPYDSYPDDKTKASWFINKDVAYVASALETYFKEIALTQPYHGTEGDSRVIPIRISDKLNRWTRIELYDQSSLIQTIHRGDLLEFTYNNIGKGAHALIAVAIQDNKPYASYPVSLIMAPATGSDISMPSVFDNGVLTPCTGPQTYSVKASCGQTYTWSVTGAGNTITSSNQNTATVNWKASGTVSVIASSGSISSQPRSLTVDTDLKSDAFSVSNPKIVQNICYINVDSATQKNELHFIKPGAQNLSDSKKFIIWRKSDNEAFDSVTTIYDISTPFIDNSSDPSIKADQYYIKLIDRCGYSHMGDTIKSVHLSASNITNNKVNFDWSTSYLNFDATYSLYRYSPSVSKHVVFTDPEFDLSYTDTLSLYSDNTSYFIELSGVTGCDSSDLSTTYKLRSNRISFNQTTGISQFNNSNNLIIAPNPTSGAIRVISNAENLNSVVILDALGKIILKQKSNSLREMTIDLSDLAKGMYVIQLDTDNGFITTKKIIKQ